jgi:hypothetical protein
MRIRQVEGGILERLGPRRPLNQPDNREGPRRRDGRRRNNNINQNRGKKPVTADQLDAEMNAYMAEDVGFSFQFLQGQA